MPLILILFNIINIFIESVLNFSLFSRGQKKSVLVHFQNILYVFQCVYIYATKILFDILLSPYVFLSSLMVPRKSAMQFVLKAIGLTSLIHPQDWQ